MTQAQYTPKPELQADEVTDNAPYIYYSFYQQKGGFDYAVRFFFDCESGKFSELSFYSCLDNDYSTWEDIADTKESDIPPELLARVNAAIAKARGQA